MSHNGLIAPSVSASGLQGAGGRVDRRSLIARITFKRARLRTLAAASPLDVAGVLGEVASLRELARATRADALLTVTSLIMQRIEHVRAPTVMQREDAIRSLLAAIDRC